MGKIDVGTPSQRTPPPVAFPPTHYSSHKSHLPTLPGSLFAAPTQHPPPTSATTDGQIHYPLMPQ